MKQLFLVLCLGFSTTAFGGDVKCTTDFNGVMHCSTTEAVGNVSTGENRDFSKSVTIHEPDFLGNTKVTDDKYRTMLTCSEDFLGNTKCK